MNPVTALRVRAQATLPWQAWARYGRQRGGILAGGLAYAALFSVFSVLVVGFAVLGVVVGRSSELEDEVLTQVDTLLPGLIDVGPDGGLLAPADLFRDDVLSVTGAVALVVALASGLGWLAALREGVRAVFGLPPDERDVVRQKLRDTLVMGTLGVAVLVSAVLGVAVGSLAGELFDALGVSSGRATRVLLQAASLVVVLLMDAVILVVLFRLLSGLVVPWRDLRLGVLFGAAALGVLKLTGGLLLGVAGGRNPLLATAGAVAGLLVWLNLASRVTLVAAALVATSAARREASTTAEAEAAAAASAAAGVAGARPSVPTVGRRAADRTAVAAGAVIGAGVVLGAQASVGAVRTVAQVVRGSAAGRGPSGDPAPAQPPHRRDP